MVINIRRADTKDFEQLYELIRNFATFIGTPEKVLNTPQQMLSDKDCFRCYVADEGDRIIGFATYFIAYYSWTGKAIYLDDLYVLESHRGLSVGSRLFDEVVEEGRAENCVRMKWQVSDWNENAIDFYRKRGATIDDVEINCDLMLNRTRTGG